jgi:LacI family transcriptional regulator
MNSVNLKLLAQELNISAASVSRALNDSYEISAATKEKVWALAKKLNYEPNPFASNLRQPKSKTLAVIVPEVANHFFSQAINGIEDVARLHDFHVLIYQTHESSERELSFTHRLLSGRVEGILLSVSGGLDNSAHFSELSKQIPLVFFDRVYDNIGAISITTNDYECAYEATQHLIDCGCRKILYCMGNHMLTIGKKRMLGYLDALKANNIAIEEKLFVSAADDKHQSQIAIKQSLKELKPDGILSSLEELSFPCYNACRELDLKIPEDVKVVSFSNSDSAPLLNPALTTVRQPALEIGKKAAAILFKLISKKNCDWEDSYEIKSSLIKRASTCC